MSLVGPKSTARVRISEPAEPVLDVCKRSHLSSYLDPYRQSLR